MSRAHDKERARACLRVLASRISPLEGVQRELAEVLVVAAGTNRGEPDTQGLVTPVQAVRALCAVKDLDDGLRDRLFQLLATLSTGSQKAVLLKGLAARCEMSNQVAVLEELRRLTYRIRGKDTDWLIANTTCCELPTRIGLRQAWRDSCGPATQLVAETEMDPLLALKINQDDYDLRSPHSLAAKRQRIDLERQGGIAVGRGESKTGKGIASLPLLLGRSSLLPKRMRTVQRPFSASTLAAIEQQLLDGSNVFLRVALRDGDKGHFVLAVDTRRKANVRQFRIHDPQTGESRWYDESVVAKGRLCPTARGEMRQVTHAYLPQTSAGARRPVAA